MINEKMDESTQEDAKVISLPSPRLDALEKLYVRTYLHTLSHIAAHRTVAPTLKTHHNDNPFSRRANVQYHISAALQVKAESLSLTPEIILERLFHEATSYGQGCNQNARIQALQILGKHLGIFQEKVVDTAPIINVINYTTPEANKPIEITDQSSTSSSDTEAISGYTIEQFSHIEVDDAD